MVHADREKLQQVMLNLLSNAITFTDRDGCIDLQWSLVERSDATEVQLVLAVTRIGIGANQLVRIFKPFVQVHSELTRLHEGTGLGLAISRDLARGVGGEITTQSTLGSGSTLIVTLPRRPLARLSATHQSA